MTNTIRGRGSIGQIADLAAKLNIHHPLIVGGKRLSPLVADHFSSCAVFSGYQPNPEFNDCTAGAVIYREEHCDGLISIGGGSAMDTAKAIKAILLSDSLEDAVAYRFSDESIPHIAIPGTAGTGAEATQFAVMYISGVKTSLSDIHLLPDGVVLDADLLDTLPEYHRKSCMLDALSQSIESYWANKATEDSRIDAYLGITGIMRNAKAYLKGDPNAAEAMLNAAYRSGKAIQVSRTTAAHAMSYGITKKLDIAHGHACLLTLPLLWEHLSANTDKLPLLMDMATFMNLGNDQIVPKLLRGMVIDLGLYPQQPLTEEQLDSLASTVNAERLSNHPEVLTEQDLRQLYRRAFLPLSPNEQRACLDIWKYYGE